MLSTTLSTTSLGLFLGAAFLASRAQDATPSGTAPTATEIAAAGELFAGRCMNCHVAPDLDFAVDRAWLGQVADTA